MANYSILKAAVETIIKTNGNEEITGANLQSTLLSIINSLGAGYQFMGVATPSTIPPSTDEKMFYITTVAGDYSSFANDLTLQPNQIGILKYDSTWSLITCKMMGDLYGDITILSTSWTDGYFINTSGNIQASTGFRYSTPIHLEKNDAIVVRAKLGTSGSLISITDEGGSYYTPVIAGISNISFETYRFRAPKECYVCISSNTDIQEFSIFKVSDYPSNDLQWIFNDQMYFTGNSVTFPLNSWTYIKRKGSDILNYKHNSTLTFTFQDYDHLVLHNDNTMELISSGNNMSRFDVSLLDYYDGVFYGGALFGLYLQSLLATNFLSGKKLSILGDSISTFGVPDQNNATGTWTYPGNRCRYPQNDLLTNVDYCYWKRLLDKYGMVLGINESWAGSRVSNNQATDSGDFGPNRCISSQTRIGHLGNNGTPDIILVYAGTNDAGGGVEIGTFNTENPINYTDAQIAALPVVTFADAYRAMLIRLLKTYQTSRIIVVLPNLTTSYYTITNLDDYIEVIKEECDFFGIKYIDTRTAGITLYNQGTYFPDGIHPNSAGMELIYKLICREEFDELNRYGI